LVIEQIRCRPVDARQQSSAVKQSPSTSVATQRHTCEKGTEIKNIIGRSQSRDVAEFTLSRALLSRLPAATAETQMELMMATQEQWKICFCVHEVLFRGTQSLRCVLHGEKDTRCSVIEIQSFLHRLSSLLQSHGVEHGGELSRCCISYCVRLLATHPLYPSATHHAMSLKKEKGTHNTQRSGCASVPDDQSCTLLPKPGHPRNQKVSYVSKIVANLWMLFPVLFSIMQVRRTACRPGIFAFESAGSFA
jgi:hypothetical protein